MLKAGWKYLAMAAFYVVLELVVLPAAVGSSPEAFFANQGLVKPAYGRFFRRRLFGRRPRSANRGFVCGRGGCQSRRVPVSRSVSRQPVSSVVSQSGRRQIVRRDDIKFLTGFNKLAQVGNNLVERRVNRFGNFEFRRLAIDRFGRLRGNRDRNTVEQLKEFYLANFDKFRGNAKNVVSRFLVRNGGRNVVNSLNGNLTVDLGTGVLPGEDQNLGHMKGKERQLALAGLNFALNALSQTSRLLRVRPQNVRADGTVRLNLNGAFRSSALALWTNNNPYACGNPNVPPRLDFLIAKGMDAATYREMLSQEDKLQDQADKIGVADDKRLTRGNKVVISGPRGEREGFVAQDNRRTLEIQSQRNRPGGSFYISWDAKANNSPGIQSDSRDPLVSGINFDHDASEAIWHKSNGFLEFGLYAADGTAATEAPATIALKKGTNYPHLGQGVESPVGCFNCHANGFIGGGPIHKTDNFGKIQRRLGNRHAQFFTTLPRYRARADRDSRIFTNAIKRSGSFVPAGEGSDQAAPLMPAFVSAYKAPVSAKQAAKELGIGTSEASVALVERFLGKDRVIKQAADEGRANKGVLARKDFEQQFCALKRIIGGQASALARSNSVVNESAAQVNALTSRSHNGSTGPTRRRAE